MASQSKACRNAEPGTAHAKRPIKAAGRCATCLREHRREQTKKSHEKRVGNLYGLLPGEYEFLYETQGGRCWICERATGTTRRLAVDHDHSVVEELGLRASVRGLLCKPCNRLLGFARDSPEFFERAAAYLRSPPAHEFLGD